MESSLFGSKSTVLPPRVAVGPCPELSARQPGCLDQGLQVPGGQVCKRLGRVNVRARRVLSGARSALRGGTARVGSAICVPTITCELAGGAGNWGYWVQLHSTHGRDALAPRDHVLDSKWGVLCRGASLPAASVDRFLLTTLIEGVPKSRDTWRPVHPHPCSPEIHYT